MAADDHVWVVILAGGVGSRFWPVSTPERPKQLLPIVSERPLIADTIDRARALASGDRVRILAGRQLASRFRAVLPDLPDEACWVEPRAKGTAPVLAWAASRLTRLDPDAVMVSLHADHLIEPLEAYRDTVAAAVEIADRDELLVCVGVVPDRVETGYGHIEPGQAIESDLPAHRVKAFHEKPDAATARHYVDAGCLWNTGIFVWKASALLKEIELHAPEVAAYLPLLDESDEAFFDSVPVSVIDRVVMERSERVGMVTATFTWDDVGSWEALSRTRDPDAAGNVAVGDATLVDSSENVVFSEAGSVVLFGVDGLVVVRTGDTTLVTTRERAPDLKTLLAHLEGDGD